MADLAETSNKNKSREILKDSGYLVIRKRQRLVRELNNKGRKERERRHTTLFTFFFLSLSKKEIDSPGNLPKLNQ